MEGCWVFAHFIKLYYKQAFALGKFREMRYKCDIFSLEI